MAFLVPDITTVLQWNLFINVISSNTMNQRVRITCLPKLQSCYHRVMALWSQIHFFKIVSFSKGYRDSPSPLPLYFPKRTVLGEFKSTCYRFSKWSEYRVIALEKCQKHWFFTNLPILERNIDISIHIKEEMLKIIIFGTQCMNYTKIQWNLKELCPLEYCQKCRFLWFFTKLQISHRTIDISKHTK